MSSLPVATIFLFLALTFSSPSSSSSGGAPLWKLSEVKALTSFRDGIRDPLGALVGWDPTTPSAPCDWRGVLCFENRVTQLALPRLQLAGPLPGALFGGLPQLRKLNLHSNSLAGSVPASISQCTLLRAVYLHSNLLMGSLPPEIFNLTNIRVLDLSRNLLSGRIVGGRFPARLRVLDLSVNSFSGELPAKLAESSELEALDLSFNQFRGQIPMGFGRLQELKFISLDSNRLYGTLPSSMANCSRLVYLSAEDNDIEGLLPWTFGSMPNLKVLSLSRNKLSGPIDSSLFCSYNVSRNSDRLRIVKLDGNALTSLSELRGENCPSSLKVIDLHDNDIKGSLPSWLATVSTLRTIDLSENFFLGELPAGIGNLSRLQELDLSHNTLSGEIPATIENCRSLEILDLAGNRFSGQIPRVLSELGRLKMISLRGNFFRGRILPSLGNLLGLQMLDLSGNNLTGNVPEDIMRLQNLTSLSLSDNRLSGGVPYSVEDLKNLVILNMSNCGLSGNIPASIGSLTRLTTLDLSMQNLSGELPLEIFGLPSLQTVAFQGNSLSGNIPEGFSSLASLRYLNLSLNVFSGQIPRSYAFLESLMILSVSSNKIHGPIPVELGNLSSLEVLELRSNRLEGIIPASLSQLSRLQRLDLGGNILTGEIPEELYKCSSLATLLLDGNRLSGTIPGSLSRLQNLTFLDLSSNNLTGQIPANLSEVPALVYLNLSRNNLAGEIPPALGSRFNDPSAYQSNGNLCGKPLSRECPGMSRKRKRLILLICLIVAGSMMLVLFCCCYVYGLILWRKKLGEAGGEKKRSPRTSSGADRGRGSSENGEPKLVMFENKITYAEALEATKQFDEENVLGRGRYGAVHKATFLDGMVLAIWKLTNGSIDERTFHKEAEALGKVKHRNLTVLRGYYWGTPNVRLLVYDYMPNGNLATLLQEASHRDGHVLNWPMRHLIALGIARGLAYLHSLPMVHGDMKPQNVLFDADFESHLSEFGLERLVSTMTAEASSSSTRVGTLGYVSPEATSAGVSTKESDVYSFGIMLLEILTGKKPVTFTPDEDIVKWVKKQLQTGQITELIEPGLLELDPESSEWEEFLLGVKVALLCTAPDPLDRPSSADVVFMLEGCRVGPDLPSAYPTSLPSPV